MYKVGKDAEIAFDTLPDAKFTGKVIEVDPGLYTYQGTLPLCGRWSNCDIPDKGFRPPAWSRLLLWMSLADASDNALLVPIEALHPCRRFSSPYLSWKTANPSCVLVQVGIRDQVSAEIKSGLQARRCSDHWHRGDSKTQ